MSKTSVRIVEFALFAWLSMPHHLVEAKNKEKPEPLRGPVAVVALVATGDFEPPIRLAREVNAALIAGGKVKVMDTEWLAIKLSENGPIGIGGVDFERLEGLFQQGYLQSYSFEYEKALSTLSRVIEGLERLPSTEEHWKLWIKAKVFQGISHMGLNDEQAAIQSFIEVLRTRPSKRLNKQEYSPKVIKLWNKAKRRLSNLPRGRLVIHSEPAGVKVLLDGMVWGKTPFKGHIPYGSYRLELQQSDSSYLERNIQIGKEPLELRYQMSFEGALVLDRNHPCVRIPKDKTNLPEHWWPWLGARLNLRHLVTVQHQMGKDRHRLSAALIDLERGRQVREGWLETNEFDPVKLREDASDLAEFLITGQAAERLQVRAGEQVSENDQSLARSPSGGQAVAEVVFKRPWYRNWWPYALAAGATFALGIVGHLSADEYQSRADRAKTLQEQDSLQTKADAWTVVAISGYVLGAAAVVTGVVLYLGYKKQGSGGDSGASVNVGLSPQGLMLWGRF